MPLFSSLLKSPTESSPSRAIPNGGLGGFVPFSKEDARSSDGAARKSEDDEMSGQESLVPSMSLKKHGSGRKKPPPVRVDSKKVSAAARTAPMARIDTDLLKSPMVPMALQPGVNARSADKTNEDQGSPLETSSRLPWPRNKKAKLARQDSGSLDTLTIREDHSRSQIIELPGSLLLPDQGYVASERSQQQRTGRTRAYSERLQYNPSVSPSVLTERSPADTEDRRRTSQIQQQRSPNSAHGGATPRSSTLTTPTMIASPSIHTLITKNINTLSADELLKILPKMRSQAVIREWIPAMQKEFAKIKALVNQYISDRQEHKTIKIFGEDLKYLLDEARKIAERYEKEIAEAQAAVDVNKQTDLEKIKSIQSQLHGALHAYNAELDTSETKEEDYLRLRDSLSYALVVLCGFIRNKLAHIMHQTDEGLTKEVTKLISAFDRDQIETHRIQRAESVSIQTHDEVRKALVEVREKYNSAQELVREQQAVGSNTSAQLDKLLNQLEQRTREQKELEIKYNQIQSQLAVEQDQNTVYRNRIAEYEQSQGQAQTDANETRSDATSAGTRELEQELQNMIDNHAREREHFQECMSQQNLKIETLTKRNAALRTQRTKSLNSARTGPGFRANVEVNSKTRKKQPPPSILLPGSSDPEQDLEQEQSGGQEESPTAQLSPSSPHSPPRLSGTSRSQSVPRITIRSPTIRVSNKDEQNTRAQFSPYRRPQYHESDSPEQSARSPTPSRSSFAHNGEKPRSPPASSKIRRPLSDITEMNVDTN